MKRTITTLALVATMLLATASIALAGEPPANAGAPTCSGVVTHGPLSNHGEHITVDYVTPGEPGGAEGAPAHFGNTMDLGPGASFCLAQANSKALPARP